LLVLVVGTASAFGTVRDLFGNGTRGGGGFHDMEGKRGSFLLRDVTITDAAGNDRGFGGSWFRLQGTPWLRASTRK
jgi:hypothetical protein